jgi:predicted transcriptional regulator of viral defense system
MTATAPSTQRDCAIDLLTRHGIMRLSELKSHGVHPPTLSRLVDQGVLRQPSRGLYEIAGADIHFAHSFAEVAKRAPKAVICLVSALQFHEITLQNSRNIWVAIRSKDRKPAIDYPRIRAVRFGEAALSLGVEVHLIDAVPVRIFDVEKTIVDCFRFRNKVGLDVALEALRFGWRARKASADKMVAYARKLRIWTVMRPYLESVVADER